MAGGGWPELPGYTVLRRLGEGATGSVLLVRYEGTGDLAALKVLSPALSSDPWFLERFRLEAEILRSLRHPHIATLYWYAETPSGALLAMQAVDGVSLRALVDQGPTSPEAALLVLRGSLDALNHAHAARVVHRDYKPEKVLVDRTGTSYLVDFGIAVPAGGGRGRAGTPGYMAPEQWEGGEATPATDVYAAGVVLFECLAGRRPFDTSDLEALRAQHERMKPPMDGIPAPLRDLVRRAMAKHPSERHASAAQFLSQLEADAEEAYGSDWQRRAALLLAAAAVAALGAAEPFPPGADGSTIGGATTVVAPAGIAGGGTATPAAPPAPPAPPPPPVPPGSPPAVARKPHRRPARHQRRLRIPRPRAILAGAGAATVATAAVAAVVVATRGGSQPAGLQPTASAHPSPARNGTPAPAIVIDIRGTWRWAAAPNGTLFPRTIRVTQEDLSTGTFSGDNQGDQGIRCTVTGTTNGTTITAMIAYVEGGHATATSTGTLGADAQTWSGTFHDSRGTTGTFQLVRLPPTPAST